MPIVFITGATGFIGQALCIEMLKSGWRVRGGFRNESLPGCLPHGVEGVNIGSIENCNLQLKNFAGVDVVIHLAARVHCVREDATNALDAFHRVNTLGTQSLAQVAAKAGVKRFVFISSIKVNGEGSLQPYTENDIPDPQDAYGISKRKAEDALMHIAAETGLQAVILRLPLVYGPEVRANFKNLVKMSGMGLPLPFKGINNRRSFIYLSNLTDAIVTCASHPLAAGETFLVSDGQDVSMSDLIKMIAYAMGKKATLFSVHHSILKVLCRIIGKDKELEKLIGSLLVDSSKIRNLLGWKPPFTLEEGIRETVKDFKL